MDKKTLTIVGVIGVIILALVIGIFVMQGNTKELSSDEIMRLNHNIYSKEEFINFVKYTLYENNGEMKIDEEEHATDISNGATKENIFMSDALQSFYQMKMFGVYAEKNNITLSGDEITEAENGYTENEEKIKSYGLNKEEYLSIAKQKAIETLISNSPNQYVPISEELYNNYISQFSGDELKSYTYRMMQVGYSPDTETESGEMESGDRLEKQEFMNSLMVRIASGEPFESVAESGDTRLIFVGNGIQLSPSIEEHSAGFLLEQKLGSSELTEAFKNAKEGEVTEVIDTDSAFVVAKVEKIEEGIVGEAKKEIEELLVSSYYKELVSMVVKDVEVNNSAISRIKIQ